MVPGMRHHIVGLTWNRITALAGPAALALLASVAPAAADSISLAGPWRFALDRQDTGLQERWESRSLEQTIQLPGSLPAQGIGDEVTVQTKWTGGIVDRSWFTAPEFEKYRQPGNVKLPFWLQPDKYYAGAAWYQRDIEVPPDWAGKRVVLLLERPHWETRVWADGKIVGTNNALATPHDYDLGQLAPGNHTLTLRVDNRLVVDVGQDSHSVSDHTQGNWNGVLGRIELRSTPLVWIEQFQLYPDAKRKTFRLKGWIGNASGQMGTTWVGLEIKTAGPGGGQSVFRGRIPAGWGTGPSSTFEWEAPPEDVTGLQLWDEFSPRLYQFTATLPKSGASVTVPFALREISTEGTQFLINGRKTFFRGTLDCCIYPKTGHPPTEVAEWKRIIGVAKAHGLNLIRFHSWCPPEAAFTAADELGCYFHVEASSWANSSTSLGDGKPVDQWLYAETDRILKYYGNHPSFVLMPYGNEPGGARHAAWLAKWVSHYKAQDPRRLWTSGAGWPQLAENQWHSTPDPRVQSWGGGLKSRINGRPPETRTDYRSYISARKVPVISHEIGQWCVYPNFDEIPKYTGYLKPKNFEIFRDLLSAHGLGDQAKQFLLASGKLQTLCYKEDIEAALRTPGMGGFELLDLHDFPGQGTALVGVLDPFWEEKGYVTPKEFSRFCNSTVPLARLAKRVFTTDERLEADLELAHFGPAPLQNAAITWKLVGDDQKTVSSGQLPATNVPVDNGAPLSTINVNLKEVPAPARYKLVVSIVPSERGLQAASADGGRSGVNAALPSPFENDWDIWVYPSKLEAPVPAGVTVVDQLNDEALAALNAGGKVLLAIPPKQVRNAVKAKVALGFSSIFWNTAWTGRQPPTTLGILCDPKHPALADFPTDYHSNWQWWYLVTRAGAMILDDLPPALRPTVQVIDDWFTARKLGLVFEAKLGQGKLLVTSIDLQDGLDTNPVARQLRASLLRYMGGDRFQPAIEVTAAQIRGLMTAPSALNKRGVRSIKADSAEPNYEPENALDGDPGTMWHTAFTAQKPDFPHELVIELQQPLTLRGFTALPRQDNNRNGWIKNFACYVSEDGKSWGEPVASGAFSNDDPLKTVLLKEPRKARFLRLVALSGHGVGPYASLAEFEILEVGK
jgi:hypothetical protein